MYARCLYLCCGSAFKLFNGGGWDFCAVLSWFIFLKLAVKSPHTTCVRTVSNLVTTLRLPITPKEERPISRSVPMKEPECKTQIKDPLCLLHQ